MKKIIILAVAVMFVSMVFQPAYAIDLKSTDKDGNVESNMPPGPPMVWWSPKYPKPFETINLTFNSVDLDGDDVRFLIEWGDGDSEWTTWVANGTNITVSYIVGKKGTYYINITAEDENGVMSKTTTVKIIVGKSKAVTNSNILLLRFLERFPILQQLMNVWRDSLV